MRRIIIGVPIAIATTGALIAAAGLIASDAALHPMRRKAASNCPRLQNSTCQQVSVTTADNIPLHAWFFRPQTGWNGSAVIVLHGIGDWRGSMTALASVLVARGFAVLTPDLRGHGESDGFCTYGVHEVEDVRAWTEWLTGQQRIERVYGIGESLGAAVLISAAPGTPRLRAIVAECSYATFHDAAKERVLRAAPDWLHWTIEPVLQAGIISARLRYGADLRRAAPIDAIRVSHKPILLIHGLADRETSPESSKQLAAANPSCTRLWLVPGAGHTMAWSVAGAEFERRVVDWFETH